MRIALIIPILLLSALAYVAAQTSLELPDIGDPAATGLPLPQEKRLAPIILRQLRSQLPVIEDVEINEYISSLGGQLLSVNPDNRLNFHFLPVNHAQINAFATPGGIVAINSGLILATESESELAGVLAHEITHVTQRHLARRIAESRKTNWIGYLAAIGTLLAAAYDSRLAQAVSYAGAGAITERALGYSRIFEREADRLGMQLMVAAGYDPVGMPQFFSRLQSSESVGSQVPEFLRTHPLTTSRLSDTLNRAKLYHGDYRDDSKEFLFIKARIEAILNPQQVLAQTMPRRATAAERYRRAVALTRNGGAREAVRLLENIPQSGETVATGLALAQGYLAQGNQRDALKLLDSLSKLHPGRNSIAFHLGEALVRTGQPEPALMQLRRFANEQSPPLFKKLLARAATNSGKQWLGHKYLADYYQANGHFQAALEQLTLAENDAQIDPPARELLKVTRLKIEKLREDMRKAQP